jgi:minor extracellular serine protease Vpr
MRAILLFAASAVILTAQIIPGRYLVELNTEPAAVTAAARNGRLGTEELRARNSQIQAERDAAEAAIQSLGGGVTHRFDRLVNGMAVTMTEQAAAQLRQTPGVRGVYPVKRHHALLDHAVNVHRIPAAWQTLSNGQAGAGAGIKIGILDTGIDTAHPAFQGFTTPVPAGFPIMAGSADTTGPNNKVIVWRVYSDPGSVDNTTGVDMNGHGTGVAMIAAGVTNDPGFLGVNPITGVAPGAWLGSYKIADDNGSSDDVTFLAGLQDANGDGMSVVNYSAGGEVLNASDENGIVPRAIANANALGTLVVVAAGNGGPALGTVEYPAVAPAAIAVGANENERFFWNAVIVGSQSYFAIVPDAYFAAGYSGQTTGPMIDVASVDGNGYACNSLPANSLKGQIALIQRGPATGACTFDSKLNNAQSAGATGAVIYDNTPESEFDYTQDVQLFSPGLSTANLPGVFISQADGQSIKNQIRANSGIQGDLDFDGITPLPHPANIISFFSSGGPTPTGNVKPDLVAVGDWYITADTTQLESQGCAPPYTANGCYPPYTFLDALQFIGFYVDTGAGTSFSTPLVTGSLAVLMAARPGLTALQYRSLIINSAPEFDQYPSGSVAGPQITGAGKLDLLGALQGSLTATPTSLNFLATTSGGGTGSITVPEATSTTGSQTVTITNVGAASDTFTVSVASLDGLAVPNIDVPTFGLAPGNTQTITVSIPGSGQLASGQYHGYLSVSGTQGQTPLRVAYWYGVPGTTIQNIAVLFAPQSDPTGTTDFIDFRSQDLIGLPLEPSGNPAVTTSSPRAQVVSVKPIGDVPGTFEAQIVTGRADANGQNVFTITTGSATASVQIQIQ